MGMRGGASLISGNKVASGSRLGQMAGRGRSREGAHSPACSSEATVGFAQQGQGYAPQGPTLGVGGLGWGGRRTRAWASQPLTPSLCCSSPRPGLLLPPRTEQLAHSHILPQDPRPWPDGPQAGNKQRDGSGRGEGVWGQDPQNK